MKTEKIIDRLEEAKEFISNFERDDNPGGYGKTNKGVLKIEEALDIAAEKVADYENLEKKVEKLKKKLKAAKATIAELEENASSIKDIDEDFER